MKRNSLPFVILMQLMFAGSLMSQTSITLTFTAYTDTLHQPLNSVVVENLTQGGDTVLYYPDTVLLLDHGIGVHGMNNNPTEGLYLYPSFPNPFPGKTTARFFLPELDLVMLRVFDLLGRELAFHQQTLQAGEHTFALYAGSETHYLLVVETPRYKQVQKLISMGGGSGGFSIEHTGTNVNYSGFRSGKSGFPWAPGDQLQFIGYASLNGNVLAADTLTDDPVLSSLYIFQFISSTQPVYPPGYVHCDPANPTVVVDVINPITGEIWMDRNLGASQPATSSTDTLSFGDLYQWGRFADGHQCRNAATTNTLSTAVQPGHGDFINSPFSHNNWIAPANDSLWQGVDGISNPCPFGYRLPTMAELEAERASWNDLSAAGAFDSPLKLPMAGNRNHATGLVGLSSFAGYYWSGTTYDHESRRLLFGPGYANICYLPRASGFSVRCIKE